MLYIFRKISVGRHLSENCVISAFVYTRISIDALPYHSIIQRQNLKTVTSNRTDANQLSVAPLHALHSSKDKKRGTTVIIIF